MDGPVRFVGMPRPDRDETAELLALIFEGLVQRAWLWLSLGRQPRLGCALAGTTRLGGLPLTQELTHLVGFEKAGNSEEVELFETADLACSAELAAVVEH